MPIPKDSTVVAYLELATMGRAKPEGEHSDFRMLLDSGVYFAQKQVTLHEELGLMSFCFMNATKLVEQDRHRYVYMEGFASPSMLDLPMHHAWVYDREKEAAVEVTWDSVGREYVGVPLSAPFLMCALRASGTYGQFFNREVGKLFLQYNAHAFEALRNGTLLRHRKTETAG